MLKQKRQWFELLFMAADLLVVSVAWLAAYWIRFYADWGLPAHKGIPPIGDYVPTLLFIWLVWAFVFRRFGLYRPMRGIRRSKEVWLLVNANTLGVLLLIVLVFLFREKDIEFSRLVFLIFGLLAILFTVIQRTTMRALLRELRRRGYNLRYMVIVGAGQVAGDLASRLRLHRESGVQLLGCLSREGSEKKGPKGVPLVGKYTDLEKLLRSSDLDQVFIALPLEDSEWLPEIIKQIGDSLVDVRIVPDLYRFVSLGGSIEEFEGLPVISVRESPITGINLFTKRMFDLIAGGLLLLLFTVPMVIIAALIKLSSRGPVYYRQERVSLDGSSFGILKFRTMYENAECDGPGWTKVGDSRVTFLGRFLRKCSLDELPQLLNVLAGDMSLVGPRPERPVFIEQFRSRIPRYMLRHKVPAGLTGWAQVNGWRGDTSIDKRIEFDLYYIEHWSLLLDLKIMVLTLFRGFAGRNAY